MNFSILFLNSNATPTNVVPGWLAVFKLNKLKYSRSSTKRMKLYFQVTFSFPLSLSLLNFPSEKLTMTVTITIAIMIAKAITKAQEIHFTLIDSNKNL